jgi:hypothetical protein
MAEDLRECPICQLPITSDTYINHLMTYHTDVFMTMFYMHYVPISPINMYENIIDEHIDDMNYEDLLELCEAIGDHKVGIQDINDIAKKINDLPIERCPICLEDFKESNEIYKTNKCSHDFCKECLVKWISEHKSCPMCQQDLL